MADENNQILQDILDAIRGDSSNPSSGSSSKKESLSDIIDAKGSQAAIDELKKQFQDSAKEIEKNTKLGQHWGKSIKDGLSPYGKYQEQVKEAQRRLEEYNDTLNDLSTEDDKRAKQELTDGVRKVQANARLFVAAENLNQSLGNLKNSALGAMSTLKGLQGSGSEEDNIAQATEMFKTAMNVTIDVATALASSLAAVASAVPFVGGAATAASNLIQEGGKIGKVIVSTASDVLSKELQRTVTTFNSVSKSGLVFADGMTGFQNAAFSSGMTLEDFSKVVSTNSESFAKAGLGLSSGVAKVGAAFNAAPAMRDQLMNLGYSFEEQGGLVAEVLSDMAGRAGPLKASDAEVAAQTAQYAENLRIISGITGEDAKKKMDEARQAANNLAFNQKLAGMDAGQRQATIAAMANMNDLQKKSFMEMTVFGSVINKEGAMMMASSQGFAGSMNEFKSQFDAGTLTAKSSAETQAKWGEQTRQELLNNTALAAAGMASSGTAASALAEQMNKMLAVTQKYTEGAVSEAEKGAKGQKDTTDEFTKSVKGAVTEVNKMQQDMSAMLRDSGALGAFAGMLKTTTTSMAGMVAVLGDVAKGANVMESIKKNLGGPEKTPEQTEKEKAAAAAKLKEDQKKWDESSFWHKLWNARPGSLNEKSGVNVAAAGGAMLTGPTSGYKPNLTMHGTELILPLTTDKKIKNDTDGFAMLKGIIDNDMSVFSSDAFSSTTSAGALGGKPGLSSEASSMSLTFASAISSFGQMLEPAKAVTADMNESTSSAKTEETAIAFGELTQKLDNLEKAFSRQASTAKDTNDILTEHSGYLRNILQLNR